MQLLHSAVAFPPCRVGEAVCQTTMIANYGDTPVLFSFQASCMASQFEIKPMNGVVPPKGNSLVCGWGGVGGVPTRVGNSLVCVWVGAHVMGGEDGNRCPPHTVIPFPQPP